MFTLYMRAFWDSHSCTKILTSSPGLGSSWSTAAFSQKTTCPSGFQQSVMLVNRQSWKFCRCRGWVKLMTMFFSLMPLFLCSLKPESAYMGSRWATAMDPWNCWRAEHLKPSWAVAFCSCNGKSTHTFGLCVGHHVMDLALWQCSTQEDVIHPVPSPPQLTAEAVNTTASHALNQITSDIKYVLKSFSFFFFMVFPLVM